MDKPKGILITDENGTIEILPPFTMIHGTADGEWVHRVDKNGKPAGGNYYGIEYEGGVDELWRELYGEDEP